MQWFTPPSSTLNHTSLDISFCSTGKTNTRFPLIVKGSKLARTNRLIIAGWKQGGRGRAVKGVRGLGSSRVMPAMLLECGKEWDVRRVRASGRRQSGLECERSGSERVWRG